MGYNPLLINEEQYTTSTVIKELHPETTPYTRLQLALETRKVKVYTPSTNALQEVEDVSRRIGDSAILSRADKEVVTVALELSRNEFSPIIVSDDYAVQNLAEFFGLKHLSLATFGIRYRFRWILYCPACKRKYSSDTSPSAVCTICGTKLKRKVLKKRAITGN